MFETVVANARVEDERAKWANYNLFGEVATNPALPASRPTLCFRPSLRAHAPSVVARKLTF